MDNLETLKKELIEQKYAVEQKGGVVSVANRNPSPSEITAGIKSINMPDMAIATATEEDVVFGKTFYAGDFVLKTGKNSLDVDIINHIFMPNYNEPSTENRITYELPSWLSEIRPYAFYNNSNPIDVYFNEDITKINNYAFYKTIGMNFPNFNNLTRLKTVSQYAFDGSKGGGINYAQLPNCIARLDSYSFRGVYSEEFRDYRFPDSLTAMGSGVFAQTSRKTANSLDLSNYIMSTLEAYCFENVAFNCDLVSPTKATKISTNFNYNGCFHNIRILSRVSSLANYCFGATDTNSISNFYLKTVVFEKETPPAFGTKCFALQHIENGFKIYVPDNSVDEYKAIANLSLYVDCIHPMSEMD